MVWAPMIAGALTGAGALLGKDERHTIDPEMLRSLFGPGALAGDTQQLFASLMNSPVFAQLMRSASLQGTALGNRISANVAAAGAGGTPIGAFARAAGRGYGTALQGQSQANLFMQALEAALGNLNMRAGLWGQSQLGQQGTPTWSRMVGSSLLNAGATGFSNWLTPAPKKG